ncbi:5-formyltetrahydrofolate cyclo-ligase [Luteimonas sp. MJ293]|uniref:5-formyltetrahydrofolate cyclo-ligase n=1 Tax=Luteimonas sp. MJ146 TaxID=3129240 RepID=UPI0031BB5E1D
MTDPRNALRRSLRQARRDIPAKDRIDAAEAIAGHLFSLPFFPQRGHVAGYWAMDGEIALHVWQMRLPADVTYCLPVLPSDPETAAASGLRFAPWRPGDPLVTNRYGIPEPDVDPSRLLGASAMDLVVLPLVGFDANGNRLGMGGGWYDRSFSFRQGSAAPPWLVGAAFAAQQVEQLQPAEWDVPLDAICTERSTHLADGTR